MGKFKIGDRVHPVGDEYATTISHWNRYWAAQEGDTDGTFFVVSDKGNGSFDYSAKKGGRGPLGTKIGSSLPPHC